MLALETGWTPDVLGDLPRRFKAACHWALFARTMVGPDGLPSLPPAEPGLTPEQRMQRAKASASIAKSRLQLYPED
jgi:hypothetical protein